MAQRPQPVLGFRADGSAGAVAVVPLLEDGIGLLKLLDAERLERLSQLLGVDRSRPVRVEFVEGRLDVLGRSSAGRRRGRRRGGGRGSSCGVDTLVEGLLSRAAASRFVAHRVPHEVGWLGFVEARLRV